MIVPDGETLRGPGGEIVRIRTLLATVRGWRYSPNMCSPIAPSADMSAAGGAAD
jgi:hypothetical protein